MTHWGRFRRWWLRHSAQVQITFHPKSDAQAFRGCNGRFEGHREHLSEEDLAWFDTQPETSIEPTHQKYWRQTVTLSSGTGTNARA